MRDMELITRQAYALTGKLNKLVLEILSHPDRDKKGEVLNSLRKRTSAVDKFLVDYLIAIGIINGHREP